MSVTAGSIETITDIPIFYGDAYFAASMGQRFSGLDGPGAEIARQAYADYQAMHEKCEFLVLEDETRPDLSSRGTRSERRRCSLALVSAAVAATAILAVLSQSSTPRSENIGAGRPAAAADDSCASMGEASLASMPIGQSGFTVNWSYFRKRGKIWVNPEYCYSTAVDGTSDVPIKRVPGGFDIEPGHSDPIQTGSMSDYMGDAGEQPMHGYLTW